MKNLQEFGVLEMSQKEINQTNGGGFFTALLIVTFVVGIIAGLSNKNDTCPE